MSNQVCSVCQSSLQKQGDKIKCIGCGREKSIRPQDEKSIHEIDMDDTTKDMDVLME
jgi:hypothetical protein